VRLRTFKAVVHNEFATIVISKSMRKVIIAVLGLMVSTAPAFAQLGDAVSSKRVAFAIQMGDPNYVDLQGVAPNVYSAAFQRFYDPRELSRPMRNLNSFVAVFRGWFLLDDYVVDPEFFWELNPSYLDGKTKRVEFSRIAKYPSLVKRYQAIQPTSVNFIVCANIESTRDTSVKPTSRWEESVVCFRALGYQMSWGASRNGTAKTFPGSLPQLREGVSSYRYPDWFTDKDPTDQKLMRNFLRYFRKLPLHQPSPNVWLDIKWPDEAIDKIVEDFNRYEKEQQDLDKVYKAEPETTIHTQPLALGDEMSKPFEAPVTTAAIFSEGGLYGLKAPNGRKVFSTADHHSPTALGNDGKFFSFTRKAAVDGNRLQIFNAAGKVVKFGEYSSVNAVSPRTDGTFIIYIDVGGEDVYRTVRCYTTNGNSAEWYRLSLPEFDEMRANDIQPLPPLNPSARGGLQFDSLDHLVYKIARRFVVDSNFRILSSGPGYILARKEPRSQERCSP
jgi:hypothetical protein